MSASDSADLRAQVTRELSCDDAEILAAAKAPGRFEVLAESGPARAGRLWTAHGPIDTPCFMPVGTYGAVKGLLPDDLKAVGTQILLGNAYHLGHRPGAARVRAWGGLHAMMDWSRPILTDSGGYQVFSLRSLQKLGRDGIEYRTHFDGSKHTMTPRSVLEIQAALGSDICMVLDHCPPAEVDAAGLRDAIDRTTRWAEASLAVRGEILRPEQLLFGIVQGGTDLEQRQMHLSRIAGMPFDGIALGGLSVGETPAKMHETFAAIAPLMPRERPRYVMGIGTPLDLLQAVRSGIDMFDCVMPTRHARNGQLFSFEGKLNIRQSRYRDDGEPIDARCGCPACQRYSRGYLRHLHEHDDPLYGRLATLHNLQFFHEWVAVLRRALRRGEFERTIPRLLGLIARHGTSTEPG